MQRGDELRDPWAHFDDSFDDRALGPQNVVEAELGSKPSQIGVRFIAWLTSLNALSASMGLRFQTVTETLTLFVRALRSRFPLVCQPGLGC